MLVGHLAETVHRPELSIPLVEIMLGDDEVLARTAVIGLVRYIAGTQAITAHVPDLIRAGDHARVERITSAWLGERPDETNPNPWLWRTLARMELGDLAGALEDCRTLVRLAPDHGPAWKYLAWIHYASEAPRTHGSPWIVHAP